MPLTKLCFGPRRVAGRGLTGCRLRNYALGRSPSGSYCFQCGLHSLLLFVAPPAQGGEHRRRLLMAENFPELKFRANSRRLTRRGNHQTLFTLVRCNCLVRCLREEVSSPRAVTAVFVWSHPLYIKALGCAVLGPSVLFVTLVTESSRSQPAFVPPELTALNLRIRSSLCAGRDLEVIPGQHSSLCFGEVFETAPEQSE